MVVGVLVWLLTAAGLTAVFERLRREFSPGLSVMAILLVFGATPLFWYTAYEPSAALAGCFAATAILLLLAQRVAPATQSWAVRFVATLTATALPTAALLLFTGAASSDAAARGVLDTLFSSAHGLLSWNPVLYVALIGTVAYASRDRGWSLGVVVGLVVLAAGIGWSGRSNAFAGGSLVAVAASFAPGLAVILDSLRTRPAAGIVILTAGALIWNYLLMVQYTVGLVPKNEPVSFGRVVRQQADVQTQPPFVYPFAFPANVWFAWREGLPIDRYDLLALAPRRASIDLTLDRQADRFLLDGWDAPGKEEWGSLWWIGLRRASLTLPLTLPTDRDIRVVVVARTRFEEPTMEAELGLEVNGSEIGRFVAPALAPGEGRSPGEARFTIPASAAGRVWRTGFNRLTFVSHGVRPVNPADPRPPGPLASRKGSAAWPVGIYRIQIHSVQ